MSDARLSSPAALRNREPIHAVLRQCLGSHARVLELASGSGEHGLYMTQCQPGWLWQPSDASETALASIAAWRTLAAERDSGGDSEGESKSEAQKEGPSGGTSEQVTQQGGNLLAPVRRDVLEPWPEATFDALVAINLIHISPWEVTPALMAKAQAHLEPGGVLFLYGPYRRGGEHTAPSNAAFDADLRRRDPRWGVRDLEQVTEVAAEHGLSREAVHELPANNLALVFRRQ
ncbi:MAG: SAM-dependent methyltransferase [Halomonas sp.]|nr:SAM-dependent methyltransferase [Halomonas sp.]|tara:strand:+ start:5259 stop:5954 length:696 start_codon:yes stop_codon:yes gene_type:complete